MLFPLSAAVPLQWPAGCSLCKEDVFLCGNYFFPSPISVHLPPSLYIYIYSYVFMRVYTIIYLCVSEREVTDKSTFYFVDNLLYFTLPFSFSPFSCISFFPSISFIHKPLTITEINQASNPLHVLALA